jgi:uncharacterized iron-regulated protein
MRWTFAFPAMILLGGCSPAVLLLGEQHDARGHQAEAQRAIESLAARGALAAVALEMAEQGRSTAGLSAQAPEAEVRRALDWNDEAWPWRTYGPVVMTGVRAGVPVAGANLPRGDMKSAMADASLDTLLPASALSAQQAAIRGGHCGLLPESQVLPMTRVQIARDRAMARTIAQLAAGRKTVVLVAGAGHVDPELGVPRHLPASIRTEVVAWPVQAPQADYCGQLRERMKQGGAG